MGCLPRRFANSRDFLAGSVGVSSPRQTNVLGKFAFKWGSLPAGEQRCAALTERLTARARTHTTPCTRARAHKGLHAKVTQPCAPARPCTRSFLTCAHRFCAGFHAQPDGLMGGWRSRHALLSPHKWARATSTGTGLPLPASAKAFGRLVAHWPTAFEPGPTRR